MHFHAFDGSLILTLKIGDTHVSERFISPIVENQRIKQEKKKKEDRKKALVTNDDLKALRKLYHNYTFRGAQWISATVVGLTTNTGP